MTNATITLDLPEDMHQRLQSMAQAIHQPLEEVVVRTIQGNLPPSVDDLPVEVRADLAGLQAATDDALWVIANEPAPKRQWQRHQRLLEKNQSRALKPAEQGELAVLRRAMDRLVLRRSYALALLKWRGHSLPNP
jgi:hypothetical protein